MRTVLSTALFLTLAACAPQEREPVDLFEVFEAIGSAYADNGYVDVEVDGEPPSSEEPDDDESWEEPPCTPYPETLPIEPGDTLRLVTDVILVGGRPGSGDLHLELQVDDPDAVVFVNHQGGTWRVPDDEPLALTGDLRDCRLDDGEDLYEPECTHRSVVELTASVTSVPATVTMWTCAAYTAPAWDDSWRRY